jgi:pyruvate kinase
LASLREDVAREARQIFASWGPGLQRVGFVPSAQNLAAYLAFRRHDLRPFQDELASRGLSSLGRSEGRVMATLDSVLATLAVLTDRADIGRRRRPRPSAFKLGERLLERNTRQLFGPPPPHRLTHIMVTLPEEAESDPVLVRALVAGGMSCARINCAHGTHASWVTMIRHVREAAAHLGRNCRVLMDLCGPRARTQAVLSRQNRPILAGDRLLLRATPPDSRPGALPFQAQCAPASILERLTIGTNVLIDEGKIRAQVHELSDAGPIAVVTRTPPEGAPVGVMIARGDLAVEVGFQRLAELQEEILWLAEAAHTPVIWATQVLDQLVKKGTPSRAEISDVVLAQRAECVMLNKGTFLVDALTIVDDVFRRMEGHQHKKTARLRPLRAWL